MVVNDDGSLLTRHVPILGGNIRNTGQKHRIQGYNLHNLPKIPEKFLRLV